MRASTQWALVVLTALSIGLCLRMSALAGDGPRLPGGLRPEPGCSVSGCHAPVKAGRYVHGPVAANFCTVCHHPEPGAAVARPDGKGRHRFRLVAQGARLCRACHEDEWLARTPSGHAPVADGRCIECHDPHTSDHMYQLRRPVPELCGKCHKEETAPRKKPHRPLVTEKSCLACHDPHVAPGPRLLREPSVVDTCARCHPKTVSRMQGIARAGKHGPVRTGACTACHDPHGGQTAALLRAGDVAVCGRCHDTKKVFARDRTDGGTRFRDGERNLHALHARAKPRAACAACHDPHGEIIGGEGSAATGQHHLRTEVRVRPDARRPLGFRSSATGGSCARSCHAPTRYDRGGP